MGYTVLFAKVISKLRRMVDGVPSLEQAANGL
jgi:hypothetical protein